MRNYRHFIKPALDFVISLILIFAVSWLLLAIIIILSLYNHGNPFFFQVRPGKYGKTFKLIKFRTMNEKRNADGTLLSDVDRLTPFGKLIRKTSMDELPQLINVFKGDMSLVGPRPLLPEYLPLYNEVQKRRHEVRPGITGWAQVNGRNTIGWNQKFEFDVWYVDNYSLNVDLKIIWLTILKVIKFEGIYQTQNSTMERFKGSRG